MKNSKLSKNELVCMWREGWCVWWGQEGVIGVRLRGTVWNNLIKSGDNTEKIWAYQFLAKPKTVETGVWGPPGGPGQCLGEHVYANPWTILLFFLKKYAKMMIVRLNIG